MIADQLKEFCDCVEMTDQDITDMVSVVSLATGWMTAPCETFEKSTRREVIDLPSCMDCAFVFEPYFKPYDVESFSFALVTIKDVDETVTPITNFSYSELMESFRVDTGLPACNCTCDKDCGCPTEYKLLVTYTAGYDEIPTCLLPVFCNLMEVIHAKNACDCGCASCESETTTYDADGNITTQQIKYKSGDVVSVFLETELGKMLVEQYKSQLGMMSLIRLNHDVWGFVV